MGESNDVRKVRDVLTHEMKRGTLVIHLKGDLDHHSAESLRQEMDRLLCDLSVHRVVLDLSGLGFMDSSGIGLIIGRYKILKRRGGQMAIHSGNRRVDRILQLSGLYEIIERLA